MLEDPPFIGDWFCEKKLGAGGFGYVTLWRNNKTKEAVAVKKCSLCIQNDSITERQKERWQYEVNLMTTKIDNDNIVRTVKIDSEQFKCGLLKVNPTGLPILIMEYCEGGDLRRVLNRNSNCSGIVESEVRAMLKALRNAISYLHDLTITHRDIKPENIVLKRDGNKFIYKLTDLGYAKLLDRTSLQASLVGTMEYLAPELLHSEKYSCSVDYWSMGVIAFEIICGVRPFLPHAAMARWMLKVREKKSEHIRIMEDNSENYFYSDELYPENRISNCFQKMMEKWLQLALEWNAKQRGCVFESCVKETKQQIDRGKAKTVKFADNVAPDADQGPIQVLKIFTLLDEILERKILIIFSMFTYQFLSYDIHESTTMTDLVKWISQTTQIPENEIEFILPVEQNNIDRIDLNTKPKDLIIEDFYEKPMLYVIKKGILLSKDIKPIIPQTIVSVFENPKVKLKIHVLKRFISNAYYWVRNENKLYLTALNGLVNYALCLNHEIIKYKPQVTKMVVNIAALKGNIDLYENTLKHTKSKLEELKMVEVIEKAFVLWEESSNKMMSNVNKMLDATQKIWKRFDSVLRRSYDALKHKKLENIPNQVFNLQNLDSQTDNVRTQIVERKTNEQSHMGMFKTIYKCLEERDTLLRDKEFFEIQQFLLDIKLEMDEIKKTVEKALFQAEKYRVDITKLNIEHHDNLWNLMSYSHPIEQRSSVIPNLDALFNGLHMNSPRSNSNSSTSVLFEIGGTVSEPSSSLKQSDLLCFGENPDTKSLIQDNQSLLMAFDHLLDGFQL